MRFDNSDGLLKYSHDTICHVIHDGKDIDRVGYVSGVPGSTRAMVTFGDRTTATFERVKDWELKSPPNGYLQLDNKAFYLTREAKRVWRTGFFKGNISPNAVWDGYGVIALTQALEKMMKQDWPQTVDQALADIKTMGRDSKLAISKRYALDTARLNYRGEVCGYINAKDKTIFFPNKMLAEYHRRNLSSKLGTFNCIFKESELKEPAKNLKEYQYDYDI